MPASIGDNKLLRFKGALKCFAVLLFLLVFALSVAGNLTQSYFAKMDKHFFDNIAYRFMPSGASQLVQARQLLMGHIKQKEISDISTLRFVNGLLNRVPQVEDKVHWGIVDYWASPAELIAGNGGDCEDFVIAKYFALRESGIAAEKMRLTYVKSFQGEKIENHMVLAYYPTPTSEPFILDNIQPQMLPASKRPDLLPVYEFNGELSDKFNGPAMRRWDDLIGRLNKEFAL